MRAWFQDYRNQKTLFVLSVILPMVGIFAVFWIYPLIDGFYGSLTDWRAAGTERVFNDFANYEKLLDDEKFHTSVINTFEYVAMYLPLSVLLSLGVALAITATGKLQALFRTVYFMPVVTSVIATSLIWAYLYQPRLGLFNQILSIFDLPRQEFLYSPDQALFSIVVFALWKNLGFNIVLFLAGMSSINTVYYDAARVDGASNWQIFRRITLPLLQPTIVFVLITGIISTLQVFGPVYVMTANTPDGLPGFPLNSTSVIATYQWEVTFRNFDLGYGATVGIALFAIIMVVTVIQARFLRRGWRG